MDTLFLDYENSLIGRSKTIGSYNFFGTNAGGANQQRALNCIRYAIEKVLEWTPKEASGKFDAYIIHAMKLERVIAYIRFPRDIPFGDTTYILSLLYPSVVKIDYQKMAEKIYQRVLETGCQFPREYFTGDDGYFHFCACLNYLLTTSTSMGSLDELYSFILSPKGNKFLHENRLKVPADLLGIDLADCLYTLTKEGEEDAELYYGLYKFENALANERKASIKAKKERKLKANSQTETESPSE